MHDRRILMRTMRNWKVSSRNGVVRYTMRSLLPLKKWMNIIQVVDILCLSYGTLRKTGKLLWRRSSTISLKRKRTWEDPRRGRDHEWKVLSHLSLLPRIQFLNFLMLSSRGCIFLLSNHSKVYRSICMYISPHQKKKTWLCVLITFKYMASQYLVFETCRLEEKKNMTCSLFLCLAPAPTPLLM